MEKNSLYFLSIVWAKVLKFEQKWIFDAKRFVCLSAVLRCLGIPSRVITNFNSAHDNTGNLKTELIFKLDGTPDRHNTQDSIWLVQTLRTIPVPRNKLNLFLGFLNLLGCQRPPRPSRLTVYGQQQSLSWFCAGTSTVGTRRSWSESIFHRSTPDGRWWMRLRRRPTTVRRNSRNIPDPQEAPIIPTVSRCVPGYFRCGPAPVIAIRDGELCHPFDCGFVFAEVRLEGDRR